MLERILRMLSGRRMKEQRYEAPRLFADTGSTYASPLQQLQMSFDTEGDLSCFSRVLGTRAPRAAVTELEKS